MEKNLEVEEKAQRKETKRLIDGQGLEYGRSLPHMDIPYELLELHFLPTYQHWPCVKTVPGKDPQYSLMLICPP
jgi:hypothetical protein